jgi:hypothetical protein
MAYFKIHAPPPIGGFPVIFSAFIRTVGSHMVHESSQERYPEIIVAFLEFKKITKNILKNNYQ